MTTRNTKPAMPITLEGTTAQLMGSLRRSSTHAGRSGAS